MYSQDSFNIFSFLQKKHLLGKYSHPTTILPYHLSYFIPSLEFGVISLH
ncbi:hypothetical protein FTV88_1620 [Heliorestis convoluta]|uniref:Uncharacterized protein n=1 Tax=Heliorestis convoluta TaxID=356322 RepID=A0A5Q2N1L7_9FIRM|nr:hypothetical protein FTV88_1620 [Heliorestis convoluta]